MQKELQIFNYHENQVRTVIKDGQPWFVVKDVCDILDISNSNMAAARLDNDEVSQTEVTDSLGRKQNTNIINESGLYSLILRSDKPQAKPFRKWVTGEILPTIRKHGAYMTPETIEKVLLNPDTIIQLATNLKEEQRKRIEAESKVKELTPAAEFGNAVSNNAGGILVRDYVKVLENDGIKIGQDKFFSWLHLKGYIYRQNGYKPQWIPYKRFVEMGLFRVKETPISSPNSGDWIGITIRITGKGQRYFYEKLKEAS